MSNIVSAPSDINPHTIDFQALHEKAMAFEEPKPSNSEPVQSVENVAPVEQTVTPQETVQPQTPSPIDLPDDALIKVKVDGQEQIVSVKEYRDGIQREASYTKRMQALADQRRETERVTAEKLAEVERQRQQILEAQNFLRQEALRLQSQPQKQETPASALDPNEIATVGELQQALAALQRQSALERAELEKKFNSTLETREKQRAEEAAIQADALRFNSALKTTLSNENYKIINDVIPFAEDALRYQVAQLNPQTMEEAIEMVGNIATEWVGKIRATSNEQLTRDSVAKARAKMEPSTSGAPATTITSQSSSKPQSALGKDGKVDWNMLRQKALSMLEN